MEYIKRAVEKSILDNLVPGKVVIVFGPRRVGKTVLLSQILNQVDEDYLLLNGEDMEHASALEVRSKSNYLRLLGNRRFLAIDEAQAIPDIGAKLKLMVDSIPGLRIIVTGSSAFDLNNKVGEPLVGRMKEFYLYPISQMELSQTEDFLQTKANLEERLIFGSYPELLQIKERDEKKAYLKSLISSYLLKDLLSFEGVKKREKIIQLLQIIAFRVGTEISMEAVGNELQISKNTVDRYLDLLSKVFIIHKLSGFSKNLDNEIRKKSKWYFYDNGLRNALISGFNPLKLRQDVGAMWENYIISERIKSLHYKRIDTTYYFWRHKNQQEIDWVEERNARLSAYEIKWNPSLKAKTPSMWLRAYPEADFSVINPENYLEFIT